MFIHIGNNLTISDRICIGIFNVETLALSEDNKWIMANIDTEDRVVVIDSVQYEPNRKFATGYNHGVVHPPSPALS